jgi:hypothetical protein
MAATESPGAEPTPGQAATEAVNQGATGGRPLGESPASVGSDTPDAFDERPEAFVGGFALAMILKRVAR